MRANVGPLDQIVRIILGLVLIALAFITALPLAANPLLQWGVAAVGAALILTAMARFCPLYTLFGLSSRKVSGR